MAMAHGSGSSSNSISNMLFTYLIKLDSAFVKVPSFESGLFTNEIARTCPVCEKRDACACIKCFASSPRKRKTNILRIFWTSDGSSLLFGKRTAEVEPGQQVH